MRVRQPRRPVADPAGRSAARLPAVPAAGGVPRTNAAPSIPTGGTRRCRRSATRDAWLAIVGLAPGKHGANRTGRPFTGDYAGELLYATLLKFGLAEGEYRADPATACGSRARSSSTRSNACRRQNKPEPAEERHLPPLFLRPRSPRCRTSACFSRSARSPMTPRRGRSAAAVDRFGHGAEHVARRPSAVELPLLALQPEHRRLDAAMFEACSSGR